MAPPNDEGLDIGDEGEGDAGKGDDAPAGTTLTMEMLGADFEGGANFIERTGTVEVLAQRFKEAERKITELSNAKDFNGTAVEKAEDYVTPEGCDKVADILRETALESKASQEQFSAMVGRVSAAVNQTASDKEAARKARNDAYIDSAKERYGVHFNEKMETLNMALEGLRPETREALVAADVQHIPEIRDLLLTLVDEMGGDRLLEHITEGKSSSLPSPAEADKRMNYIHASDEYRNELSKPEEQRSPAWQKLHKELMNCGRAIARSRA